MSEALKVILEHADVLSAGIAGLLIFALLVIIVGYKLTSRIISSQGIAGGVGGELAVKAMQTLGTATQGFADATKEFADSADRQSTALSALQREIAESRKECADRHTATQVLVTQLLNATKVVVVPTKEIEHA